MPKWFQSIWGKLGLAGVLLLWAAIGIRSSLPQIAINFNDRGLNYYRAEQYDRAEFYYRLSLFLSPNQVETNYNLGALYQKRQDYDRARSEYEIAIRADVPEAYNNLGRLHIIEGDLDRAIFLLEKGLNLAETPKVRYAALKNLGWALLGQERYSEAEVQLGTAIDLAGDRAPAHCLLAQALEGQEKAKQALGVWKSCLQFPSDRSPEMETWRDLARQRIKNLTASQ